MASPDTIILCIALIYIYFFLLFCLHLLRITVFILLSVNYHAAIGGKATVAPLRTALSEPCEKIVEIGHQ